MDADFSLLRVAIILVSASKGLIPQGVHSTSGSGAPRLKQIVIFSVLLCGLASFIACSNSNNPTQTTRIYPHRALISNTTGSRIDIADTTRDLLVTAISADLPGKLLMSSDKKYTLALSPITNSVSLVVNSSQTGIGSATLAGASESVILTVDNALILAAVPGEAGPVGQAPGAVDVVTVTSQTTTQGTSTTLTRQPSIFLPGARFVAATPNTNTILAVSDSVANPAHVGGPTGRVWAIKTSLVNTNTLPYQEVVSAFWDHPVFAIADAANSTAYILNCGPECGGTQASLVKVDLTVNPPVATAQLVLPSGGTFGLLTGNTLFVAGSDPSVVCPTTPSIPSPCGAVTPVDLTSFTSGPPVAIAGGTHDRIALGSNGLLFVGARGCNVIRDATDATKGAGCLSLVNTATGAVTVAPPTAFTPPATGPGNDDVTGIAPIANRNEVYVIEAAELVIYDTTTLAVKKLNNPPNIVGQGVDVVAIDF